MERNRERRLHLLYQVVVRGKGHQESIVVVQQSVLGRLSPRLDGQSCISQQVSINDLAINKEWGGRPPGRPCPSWIAVGAAIVAEARRNLRVDLRERLGRVVRYS